MAFLIGESTTNLAGMKPQLMRQSVFVTTPLVSRYGWHPNANARTNTQTILSSPTPERV